MDNGNENQLGGQKNTSQIIFNERDCKAVIGELSHIAIEIKEEFLKSHKELLKSDLQFAVKRPENQIFNALIFLQSQILKNKYSNKQNVVQFNKTLRKVFGLVYFLLLKSELKKYQKIFDEAIKHGLNPLEEICIDLYNSLTNSNFDRPLEAAILSGYLASVENLWDLIVKLFYTESKKK